VCVCVPCLFALAVMVYVGYVAVCGLCFKLTCGRVCVCVDEDGSGI